MTRPIRNYEGVQHEVIRTFTINGQRFDDIFNNVHDTLEEAYYGDRDVDGKFVPGTGWKDGISKPFTLGAQTFDVQPTPAESKALFDRLHSLLWERYVVAKHRVNSSVMPPGRRLAREDYDVAEADDLGNVTVWKSDLSQARLDAARNDPIKSIDFPDPTA